MKTTIAIIDDNPNNLNVLFKIFEGTDYEIAFFRDAHTFLETLSEDKPDLILLDIIMPGMTGFDLIKVLKDSNETSNETRDIPVIFMSALDDTPNKINGFDLGAVDYITKPFQPNEVLARVKTQLKLSMALKQVAKSNQLLAKKNKELANLNATKDRFFSIISHDLINPFSSLRGNAELVINYYDKFSAEEFKNMVLSMSEVALYVVNMSINLLSWAKIQKNGIAYSPQKTDIKRIVENQLRFHQNNSNDKEITVVNNIEQNFPIVTDVEITHTILRNLISNAIKFTNKGGQITVSAKQMEGRIAISVSDNGIGIEPQNIAKLFRIDEEYRRKGTEREQGAGLGLILCKELLNRIDGSIEVKSAVGEGSTFTFVLKNNETSFDGDENRVLSPI